MTILFTDGDPSRHSLLTWSAGKITLQLYPFFDQILFKSIGKSHWHELYPKSHAISKDIIAIFNLFQLVQKSKTFSSLFLELRRWSIVSLRFYKMFTNSTHVLYLVNDAIRLYRVISLFIGSIKQV